MPLQTRNIGRIPVYFGDYVPGRAYQEKHRVTLYGSEFQAAKDNPLKAPLIYDTSTSERLIDSFNNHIAYSSCTKLSNISINLS